MEEWEIPEGVAVKVGTKIDVLTFTPHEDYYFVVYLYGDDSLEIVNAPLDATIAYFKSWEFWTLA